MTVGLYDLDYWHSPQSFPNLELMKVFNYYYSKGDIVTFISPKENLERFNKIIYFKENKSTKIPVKLNLLAANAEFYGKGFRGELIELKPEYKEMPPSFLLYDFNNEKFKGKLYEKIKKNSLVRVENKDYTYLKNSGKIYIVDKNPIQLDCFEDFCKQFSNRDIVCLSTIQINSETELKKYAWRFPQDRIYINYEPNKDFFDNYKKETNFVYCLDSWNKKDINKFISKLVSCIFYFKKNDLTFIFETDNLKSKELNNLVKNLYKWSKDKDKNISFYNFYVKTEEDYKNFVNLPLNNQTKLLLKQFPKTVKQLTLE